MNLQTHINNNLWLAILSTYESGNFSDAILDAMHYLSNLLRDKTGVDGDGAALVGQTLGGDPPRLRINRMQTETEKNQQRGMESIIRGMYQAIRNPRSHEQIEDTQETADAVIYFINYLVGIIENAEEPFVLSKFMSRVFDPDFYKSQRYAELLVAQIPANKRFDTLVSIYRQKLEGDIYHIGLVIRTIIGTLTDDQVKEYLSIVGDELSTISSEKEIRYNLHLLPFSLWNQLPEISRLRIENRIIRDLGEGEFTNGLIKHGALSTWARDFFQYFSLKARVETTLANKLGSNNILSRHYVVKYFLQQLPEVALHSYEIEFYVRKISEYIREGDVTVKDALIENICMMPEPWRVEFSEALKDMTNKDHPAAYLPDGSPFLTSDEPPSTLQEDEIPF